MRSASGSAVVDAGIDLHARVLAEIAEPRLDLADLVERDVAVELGEDEVEGAGDALGPR